MGSRLAVLVWLATALGQAEHRRLFLDPLVVHRSQGVERVFHQPEKHSANQMIRSDQPWEAGSSGPYLYGTVLRENGKFRMWYHAVAGGYRNAYAESLDGIHWTKPNLGILGANNLFVTVSQDADENPPRRDRGQCHNPSVVPRPGGGYALFCYGADYDKVRGRSPTTDCGGGSRRSRRGPACSNRAMWSISSTTPIETDTWRRGREARGGADPWESPCPTTPCAGPSRRQPRCSPPTTSTLPTPRSTECRSFPTRGSTSDCRGSTTRFRTTRQRCG